MLGAFVALVVVLAPTGSAKAPSSGIKKYDACLRYNGEPACGTGSDTLLPGGATAALPAKLTLTITNLPVSNQMLGSLNLDVPASAGIEIVSVDPIPPASAAVALSGTQLQLRNLNLPPSPTGLEVTLYVKTPCTGTDLQWNIVAKQSNNFLGTGNDFTKPTGVNATGLKTDIQECYHVEFINQPKTTVVGATITDADYSRGGPIEVGLFDNSNVRVAGCPAAAEGSEVTITKAPSAGSLGGDVESLVCSSGVLVATFDDLSIGGLSQSALPATYNLTASGVGTQDTSDSNPTQTDDQPFSVIYGVPCTTSGCPSFTTSLGGNQVTSSATAGTFTFLAIISSSIPNDVVAPDAGCEYYKRIPDGAFEAIEGRSSDTGELRFTYYVKKTELDKLYGSTSGQQFVPLCAGAAWVDRDGNVMRCDDTEHQDFPGPWKGKALNQDGKFAGPTRLAVCGEGGLFWGILGSFQDYTGANTIDPETSPTVTGWGSGGSYRHFDVRVPAPWDWKMG